MNYFPEFYFKRKTVQTTTSTEVNELLMMDIKTRIRHLLTVNNIDTRTIIAIDAELKGDSSLKIVIHGTHPSRIIGRGGEMVTKLSGYISKSLERKALVDVKQYSMWDKD